MLIRCFTPTFSETELPPQEPQPEGEGGSELEVVKIADAAVGGGGVDENTAGLHALGELVDLLMLGHCHCRYREEVWP